MARSALAARLSVALLLAAAVALVPVAASGASAALPQPQAAPAVVINEVAAGSSRSGADSFFELRNISESAVDLSGWGVYRCSATGLRAKRGQSETELSGVVLAPGEVFTAGRVGVVLADGSSPDAIFSNPFASTGFGLYLEGPDGELVDAVAVYPSRPSPTTTECSAHGNLPNSLARGLDESWQRVSATGVATDDFVRATATPGVADAAAPDAPVPANLRIDEVAPAGPAGSADDFVELRNAGGTPVDIGGWRLYRCTAVGDLSSDTLQTSIPEGTVLAGGDRYLLGGPGYVARGGEKSADASSRTSLADAVSGVLLTTADGRRVDGVTISNHLDTACQTGDRKLASELDYRSAQSWQRHPESGAFVVATRTPGRENAGDAVRTALASTASPSSVAISEFAVDPVIPDLPEGVQRHHFVELGNYGTRPVPIGGWQVIGCRVDGFRDTSTLVRVPEGASLRPGDTWLAALAGTPAAVGADAVFDEGLDFLGTGFWVEDAAGRRVTSVGAYHANEMDFSLERHSPCSNGLSLATFAPDRLRGETYARSQFTGSDVDDFVTGPATPGAIDERRWLEPWKLTEVAAERLSARTAALLDRAPQSDASAPLPSGAEAATIVAAHGGATAEGRLDSHTGAGEWLLEPAGVGGLRAGDDGYGHPYVRMTVTLPDAAATVSWRGQAVERTELALSVWNEASGAWRELARGSGPTDNGMLVLGGAVLPDERRGGNVEVLVQSVPRESRLALEADGAFADPEDYDLAISHITDTQYLTEAYPEVYAEAVGWILANRDARKIGFATHTGDLVQNWVDPDQTEPRARREFGIASEVQAMLDDAGMPNSVLPGNHDNKRGITNDLFNEYFGPDRYADASWYGGSIAPDDNSANYALFERAGARFLMLSLPYAFGARELAWAEDVVMRHPDRNVIVSTHEHVTPSAPDTPVGRSVGSRWISRGGELWERVVAPNRNVVAVLSGHFHGLGSIVTEDAGGIDGHTVVEMVADYQEFRTHTGERATGFQRLLQIDLAGGRIAVDTFSSPLGAHASYPYDYEQFVPENGRDTSATNARPWNVLAAGLQSRYSAADDDFGVPIAFQYDKRVVTEGVYASR